MKLRDLRPNTCIWHNQMPYKLIGQVWLDDNSAKWMAERCFVSHDRIDIIILRTDSFHIANFHTRAA